MAIEEFLSYEEEAILLMKFFKSRLGSGIHPTISAKDIEMLYCGIIPDKCKDSPYIQLIYDWRQYGVN